MSRFAELLDQFFYRPDEDVGSLFELSTTAEDAPDAVDDELPGEFLAFSLDEELYAAPIRDVREIVKVPSLTEIPRAPASLLGVMNLRGEVLPVHDVKMRLHLSSSPPRIAGPADEIQPLPKSARILVVRGEEGDAGVLVDKVTEVVKMKPSALEPPPPGVAGGDRDLVVGLGRRREQLFIIVDLQQAI